MNDKQTIGELKRINRMLKRAKAKATRKLIRIAKLKADNDTLNHDIHDLHDRLFMIQRTGPIR